MGKGGAPDVDLNDEDADERSAFDRAVDALTAELKEKDKNRPEGQRYNLRS